MVLVPSRVENCTELRWSPPWWARRNGDQTSRAWNVRGSTTLMGFFDMFRHEVTVCEQKCVQVIDRFTLTLWCIWSEMKYLHLARLHQKMTLLVASSQKCSIHLQQLKSSLFKHALCIVESCCQIFGVDGASHIEGWPVSSVFLRGAFVKLLVVCRHILRPKAHTTVSKLWDTCDFHLAISLQHPAIVKIVMTAWGRRRPFSGKWHSQYLSCLWLSGVSVTPWPSELWFGVGAGFFFMMLQGYYMIFGMGAWVRSWHFWLIFGPVSGMFCGVQPEAISTTLCSFGWTPGWLLVQRRGDGRELFVTNRSGEFSVCFFFFWTFLVYKVEMCEFAHMTWFYKYFPWMVKWSWKKSKV